MAKRMFEKSCQCQVHRTWYRLHASSPEAEVSTYSTEFDGSQDFSNTLLAVPYAEREAAKATSAKWDWREKLWYSGPEGTRPGLAKWLQENAAAAAPAKASSAGGLGFIASGSPVIPDQFPAS